MLTPRRRLRVTSVLVAAAIPLGAATGASAMSLPAPGPTAPPATTTEAAPPPPAVERPRTALRVSIERAPRSGVLQGDRWRARVSAGTRVTKPTKAEVRFTVDGKRTITRTVRLTPTKKGRESIARVVVPVKARRGTRVAVRAKIPRHQPVAPVKAKVRIVVQASPSVRAGQKGQAVRILQSLLDRKGYVIGQKGVYDARTQRAVLAFRKVARMSLNFSASSSVFRALRAGKGRFRVRFPSHGRHVEGDIDRRVLALIGSGGKVQRIYHTSPGKPSTPTIRGSFRVYMKDPGTNAKGMYKSSYFIRGYAVHGYPEVPLYSASHGCLRVPMADAESIYRWMSPGMRVDTY